MEKLIIEARQIDGKVAFTPVRVEVQVTYSKYQPLVYVADEIRWFETFQEAQGVINTYASLDPECGCHVRWDYDSGDWEYIEGTGRGRRTPRDPGREDFHADG